MNVTEHQRPGVYSVYDVSSVSSGRTGGRAVGLVALCNEGVMGSLYTLTDPAQAAEIFTAEQNMTKLIEVIFANGAGKVYAVGVGNDAGYQKAFKTMEDLEDIAVMVCDHQMTSIQMAMHTSVKAASASRRERLGVVFGYDNDSVSQLKTRADQMGGERMVLVSHGGVFAAAALAGVLAAGGDPAMPLSGVELKGVTLTKNWTDSEVDALILGGVTPLEQVGGVASVVRAVTTRTKTGSVPDATWRELTTIRIVDEVIPDLRNALRAKFVRAKNTPQGRGAIRNQVIVELESKLRNEIITGYDDVTVSAVEDNPTVCLVEFKFTVAHGLNQIWLSAHITV